MYKEHHPFEKPSDEDIKIWRYIDFTKFVSLLDKQALFFARADRLRDPFEGSYSKANIELRPIRYKGIPEDSFNEMQRQFSSMSKECIRFTIINSWHMNGYESAAMWELYLKSDEGVAIQSTFKRLKESFLNHAEHDVYIGTVKYIDYETEWLPEGFTFYPFLHKRKSFEHERELRAIVQKFPTKGNKIDYTQEIFDDGAYINVNLYTLIEKIFVSPTAPKWFNDVVKSIVNKYDLNKEVTQSSLAEGPVY